MPTAQNPTRHVIKRYAATRLYDTTALAYTSIPALHELLRTEADVVVYDVPSGADITAAVLAHTQGNHG